MTNLEIAATGGTLSENYITIGNKRYVTAERLCALLGIHMRTLNRWRHLGTGPAYIQIGRTILFDVDKVNAWLEAHTVTREAERPRERRPRPFRRNSRSQPKARLPESAKEVRL